MCSNISSPISIDASYFSAFQPYVPEMPEQESPTSSMRTPSTSRNVSTAYHAPCHARNQGLARQALETFRAVDGAEIEDVGDSCSGISGTYGWKAENYDYSMEIGEEMFEHMEDAEGEVGMTECPTDRKSVV